MLRVSFNLGDEDLQHFSEVAQQTQALARLQPEAVIVGAARAVLERADQAQPTGFLRERYSRLRAMLEMLADAEWNLRDEDRQRVVNALACFTAPAPSGSATELLDHAIMIELVSRDLQHDLEAYDSFCRFRESQRSKRQSSPAADREQWLSERREALRARMHERRRKDLDKAGSAVRRFFSLFGL